ncbi:iron ABC transporter permease [Desulfovibrio subterraneus]|uniref:FecCD family ABC transporter permease n=1 Tax=Desulfovibrio subterraneus TaxID=2718620 RepID=UPI0022B8E32A|nr:iron ABC transporter permease [Desulfovibrio subterraneus]WBF67014.1 iron ABC transporter permease [Desulfovibrio subterraneus]
MTAVTGNNAQHPAQTESRSRRFRLTALCALAACVVSVAAACLFGPVDIPAAKVFSLLWLKLSGAEADRADVAATLVVWDIRLGRIVLSLMVGAALGMAGTVFQGILRNPLADPFTLGVSSGAAFGASLAIMLGVSATLPLLPFVGTLPAAAMTGALAALFAVIMLGRSGGRLRRESLVLAGVVIASFLAALISLVKSLDEESVASIVFWIMGSLQGRGWRECALVLPWFGIGCLLIWRFSRELDILALGDTQARQLGMNADRVRLWLLIGASMLTGASVAVSGVIGFVGLVVPHLMRMAQGGEHRPLLVSSALAGGLLLLWSDVLARTILPEGAELPVGVVTALLGGPFFCLLLRRRMREDGI